MNQKIPSLILSILLAFVVFVLIWGINKGFDLSDEGLYMLNFLYPNETAPYWKYGVLFNQIFGWLDFQVIEYRALRLVLTLFSTWVLTWGFWHWMKNNTFFNSKFQFSRLGIFAFLSLGSLVGYSFGPQTLSYNSLLNIDLQFILGLFFYYLFANQKHQKIKAWASLSGIGFILMLMFFTKFSAAILVLGALVFWIALFHINRNKFFKNLILDNLFLLVGIIFGLNYFALSSDSLSDLFAELSNSLSTVPGHDLTTIYKTYTVSSRFAFVDSVLWMFEIPILFLLLIWFKSEMKQGDFLFIFLGILIYTCVRFFLKDYFKSGLIHVNTAFYPYISILFSFLVLHFLIHFKNKKEKITIPKREVYLVSFLLFFIPILASAGTNNSLPLQCVLFLSNWFLLFYILLIRISEFIQNKFFAICIVIFIGIISVSQTIFGFVYAPYRLNGNLFAQKENVENLEKVKNLKLDLQSKNFILKIDSILNSKIKRLENQPMISVNASPGIVYLLNGISPGSGWYKYYEHELNCFNIQKSNLENLNKSILFVEGDGRIPNEFVDCLNEKGFDFPSSFSNVGVVRHPLYGSNVNILVPRSLMK